MSLKILLIGTPGVNPMLYNSLEAGLHEVKELPASANLSEKVLRDHVVVIIHIEPEVVHVVLEFVLKLKSQSFLRHVPVIAYLPGVDFDGCNAVFDVSFDDVFRPGHAKEYDYIAKKVTALYRRLQNLRAIQIRTELLGLDAATTSIEEPHWRYGLLLDHSARNLLGEFARLPHGDIHQFESCEELDGALHVVNIALDIIVIDAKLGLPAMKLASRVSSDSKNSGIVIVLIPEDQMHLSQQCLDIRVHDFLVMPIESPIFCQKITIACQWLKQCRQYNSSFDLQLNLSIRDELTKLYNRRYMNRLLDRLIEQSALRHQQFVLGMVDIDFFKKVNDSYSHLAGDEILQQVARLMEFQVRRHDSVGRWGGEEFMIVFVDVPAHQGKVLAERIRQDIAEQCFEVSETVESLRITVSVGIAAFGSGDNLEQIVRRADRALYAAKAQGRNCVIGTWEIGELGIDFGSS